MDGVFAKGRRDEVSRRNPLIHTTVWQVARIRIIRISRKWKWEWEWGSVNEP